MIMALVFIIAVALGSCLGALFGVKLGVRHIHGEYAEFIEHYLDADHILTSHLLSHARRAGDATWLEGLPSFFHLEFVDEDTREEIEAFLRDRATTDGQPSG